MSKVSLSSQSRNFHFVLYPDSESYFTTKVLFDSVVNLSFCSKWAYCLHDKDVSDDGQLLKPHYHLVISCKYPVRYIDILKKLELPDSSISLPTQGKSLRSFRSMVRYLVHADSPKKHQYDLSEIGSSFDVSDYFDSDSSDSGSSAFVDLLNFMSDKKHNRREIALYAVQSGYLGYYRQYYRILWDIIDYEDFSAYIPARDFDDD